MRTIRRTSLALISIPILFSGCLQEKVSTITPSKLTNNKIELTSTKHNLPTIINNVSTTNIKEIKTKIDNFVAQSNVLDKLALSVQNSMDIQIIGDDKIITEALEVGENWQVLTKKDDILATAKEYLGVKYIWAANGPTAFDCSGYTKYIFKEHGIALPRYSGHQANIGIKVSFNELEKGDLVFFDTERRSHGKVNHVGIYIGDGKFIHASSGAKRVMITSFNKKKFYKRKFLHGQRILDSVGNFASLNVKKAYTN